MPRSRNEGTETGVARRAMLGRLGAWGAGALGGSAALGQWATSTPAQAPARARGEDDPAVDAAGAPILTDVAVQSSGPLFSLNYRRPADAIEGTTAAGAAGANAAWERGKSRHWFIEEQRAGLVAAIGGIVTFDPRVVDGAIRLFDWGFARQAADGGFAGTGDPFHSTSIFVAAVTHAGLFVRDAARIGCFPLAESSLQRMVRYTPIVLRAADWLTRPEVWAPGLSLNTPYTHRRYVVGAALGLTAILTGEPTLIDLVSPVLEDGLARQQPDGVNPELGGSDSSYQMAGVVFAQYWVLYLPDHPLTPRIRSMIERALTWEASRVLPSGEVSTRGNTRTGGQERLRDGIIKSVAYSEVIRGFATWAALTGNPRWAELAWRTGRYYYNTPALARRPLLP